MLAIPIVPRVFGDETIRARNRDELFPLGETHRGQIHAARFRLNRAGARGVARRLDICHRAT